jgi:hypothetical protein
MMSTRTSQPGRIIPDVRPLSLADYEAGLRRYIELFGEQHAGPAAIYQFGKIRTPGVSDIDLAFVVSDTDWRRACAVAERVLSADDRLSYLFTHEPVVVCESLLPHLACFHSLEGCRRVSGESDPLATAPSTLSEGARLMRQAVWSSFMRVAGWKLAKAEIGLRRVLILLHNLLAAAAHANSWLAKPSTLHFTTEEVRGQILEAAADQQVKLCREFIDRTWALLDEVDARLNAELAERLGFPLGEARVRLHGRTLASRVSDVERELVVPDYQLVLTGALRRAMGEGFEPLAPFQDVPGAAGVAGRLDLTDYTRHLKAALKLFDSHRLKFSFPTPFQCGYAERAGWASRLARWFGATGRAD